MSSLHNKVAIITGGGSGIGAATARALAGEGAHIVLAGRRQEVLNRVAAEIKQGHGVQALAVSADVSDEAQVRHLLDATLGTFDRVDILVNNAGISHLDYSIAETPATLWDKIMAVNLRGPFLCAKAVLPAMLAQAERGDSPAGIIVNIASEAAKFGYAQSGAYTASKWGLLGLSHVLEAEVMDKGIKVVAIHPGMVQSEMTNIYPERIQSRFLRSQDVAELIRWICTAPANVRITEVMMRTMVNPWK